jgi:hypothetical protein
VAFVQRVRKTDDWNGLPTTTVVITPTGGNLLALGVVWRANTATISTVTDNQGNTWQTGIAKTTNIDGIQGFYAENVVGAATTITITWSAVTTQKRAIVHEYSGRATTGALDAGVGLGQTDPGTGTDAVTSGAATVSQGSDVFGCSSDSNSEPAFAAGTGYTLGTTVSGTADEYAANVSSGSRAVTFTSNISYADPVTILMAFKVAAGGGGIVRQMLMHHEG